MYLTQALVQPRGRLRTELAKLLFQFDFLDFVFETFLFSSAAWLVHILYGNSFLLKL